MRNIGIAVLAAGCVMMCGCGGAASGQKARDADAYHYAKSHEMQQVLVGAVLYTDEHKGNWPDSLEQVTKYLKGQAVDLRVYEYRKPSAKLSPQETATTVVLLEKLADFGGGELAGFADGHVEFRKSPGGSGPSDAIGEAAGAGASVSEFAREGFVGHWKGRAKLVVDFVADSNLPVDIAIDANGIVAGSIGDAKIKNAMMKKKGFIDLVLLRHKTRYIIEGTLEGDIIAKEGLRRDRFTMALDIEGGKIVGSVGTSGAFFGGRNAMLVAHNMVLERK